MPYSYATYTGDGSTTQFAVPFGYIRREHVKVYVAFVDTAYTYVNSTTVQLATAPTAGQRVEVRRVTPVGNVLVDFADGSTLVAADLDAANLQHLYLEQELDDYSKQTISIDPATGLLTASGQRITNVANPVDVQDAATKAYVDGVALAGTVPDGDRGDITVSGTGTVWTIDSGLPASRSSFTQSGTGAVARTVDSKLKDIIDRDDFNNDTNFNNAAVGKVAINGTNTVLAPRFEGNTTTDSGTPDAVFRVNRTHTGAAAPHSFRDQTVFNPSSANVAACCFDAALTSSGTQNQDHTIGFQARNDHNGTGTLTYLQGFGSYLKANGPVTNSHGLEINSVTGGGTVTNEYGVYIKNLTKGTNKYPIFIANNLGTNSIGAATNFNNNGVVSVGGTIKLFLGDAGNGYKSIAYNHNMQSNTYDYGDQIQSVYFGPQDITFRCAPVGTAGATPTFTNILNIRTDSTNPSFRAVFPSVDNVSNLGLGGFRWKEIFSANGTINTSDARVKTEVRQLSDPEIAAAKDLAREVGAYKFIESVAQKGDAARTHIGMTVQRCIEIMEHHGLDPVAYGFICYNQWEDEYEEVSAVPSWVEDPETGELVQGPDKKPAHQKLVRKAGDLYSFRTEQLLLFIARGFEARLSALETALRNSPATPTPATSNDKTTRPSHP